MNFSQEKDPVKEELLLDLKGMTIQEYAILILREDYRFTYEAIAKKLNMSVSKVRILYHEMEENNLI